MICALKLCIDTAYLAVTNEFIIDQFDNINFDYSLTFSISYMHRRSKDAYRLKSIFILIKYSRYK